jgi:hypothetical protein
MDNRLEQDALIEDALKSYPLAEMPRSITVGVMARVQKDVRPKLVTWNDFALSVVLALSISAVFFAVQSLPPIMLAKLRIQGILLYQDFLVNARWLVPSLLFVAAAFLSALTIPTLVQLIKVRR